MATEEVEEDEIETGLLSPSLDYWRGEDRDLSHHSFLFCFVLFCFSSK